MGAKRKQKLKKPHFNSIVIATFSAWKNGKRTPTNGMIEPLLSFFGPISKEITLIDCPHPGSDNIIPQIEIHKDNTLYKTYQPRLLFPSLFILKRYNQLKTQPVFKIRDFFTIIQVLLSKRDRIDLFVGLESINTLAGIILKKLGKVKTAVYYVSDYSPNRYPSKLFNNIYLWLDRFCATYADYIWDVSPSMMPARIKIGLDKKKSAPVIHVPNALFPWQIKVRTIDQLEPFSLAFAGTIGPENGLDLAIEALSIAKKKIPQLKLHIFGGGLKKDEEKAKNLVHKLKLGNSVINHGFISDLKKLSDLLSKCMIGLAPYTSIPSSVRWYADATKIRLYFANGLPVVTTQVPPLGKEAKQKGCAIIAKDDKREIAQAIVNIAKNKEKYLKFRKSAISFAQNNTWNNTYRNALRQMKKVKYDY